MTLQVFRLSGFDGVERVCQADGCGEPASSATWDTPPEILEAQRAAEAEGNWLIHDDFGQKAGLWCAQHVPATAVKP